MRDEPDDPESLSDLGTCLLGLERVEDAMASHLRALELDPDHSPAMYGLARCFDVMGDAPQARSNFERYLGLHDEGESADEARAWLAANQN